MDIQDEKNYSELLIGEARKLNPIILLKKWRGVLRAFKKYNG